MAEPNVVPLTLLESRPRRRWRLWLTISSPFILICVAIVYYRLAARHYAPAAEAATAIFHQRFHSGQDAAIYSDAGIEWTSGISLESQKAFFGRVRRKLGPCSYRGPLSRFVNVSSNGVVVSLRYRAECSNGPMLEIFTWRVKSDQTSELISYQAMSKLLLSD
jgi:hypothetical protein